MSEEEYKKLSVTSKLFNNLKTGIQLKNILKKVILSFRKECRMKEPSELPKLFKLQTNSNIHINTPLLKTRATKFVTKLIFY